MTPRLISITGPESSGKTTLAYQLGQHIEHSIVVDEYARTYLRSLPDATKYNIEDVMTIANHQHAMIESARSDRHNAAVICDTDYLVLHIWMLEVFGHSFPELEGWCEQCRFDIYLLCRPDLHWEPDPLRENPCDRDRLFQRYVDELKRFRLPYEIISGSGPERPHRALAILSQ